MRLKEYEKIALNKLKGARIESPGLCARALLCHVARISREQYITNPDLDLDPKAIPTLCALTDRLCAGEPLAYVLGKKEFFEHTFFVDKSTLIPRPETESLVEKVLELLPREPVLFMDAGTGSGCIGISLLAQRPGWQGLLLDNSPQALAVARKNALNLAPRALLLQADMFNLPLASGSLDLVISNPPYIGIKEKAQVMPQVLEFEPHQALFSDDGGLAHAKAIIRQSFAILKKGGWLGMEHGFSQRDILCGMMRTIGYSQIIAHKDLAGLPRFILAKK